ncbi:IS200/IS605 family transposase [Bifidobacterium callitrichidarum]|uniref:IS200/IS605 family transposase n=1 Tax=Bifidobacterium callitrichidarum TaxID=2052941 RepID=A0A2U2MZ38_9BIFI|nr:IS200/IS605 family transposase [Bifidobacterium callitrichidarum]PWG62078.1 IS200/IS605 family transposase [Bifidobacterium callitrichidarum]
MTENDQLRHGRTCVTDLQVHLVFVTKYRRNVFDDTILTSMETIMRNVCHDLDARLIEFNGEDDHVHLLVEYPPKLPVSTLVNSLKGVSSRLLRKQYKLKTHHNHLWSPSYYAASSGGTTLETLKTYIRNQRRPD